MIYVLALFLLSLDTSVPGDHDVHVIRLVGETQEVCESPPNLDENLRIVSGVCLKFNDRNDYEHWMNETAPDRMGTF